MFLKLCLRKFGICGLFRGCDVGYLLITFARCYWTCLASQDLTDLFRSLSLWLDILPCHVFVRGFTFKMFVQGLGIAILVSMFTSPSAKFYLQVK
jgi:hypothetical protein